MDKLLYVMLLKITRKILSDRNIEKYWENSSIAMLLGWTAFAAPCYTSEMFLSAPREAQSNPLNT